MSRSSSSSPQKIFDRVVWIPRSSRSSREASIQIEMSDGPEFHTDLQQALRDGLTALGLLGWEFKDGTLQAKGGLFP